jgi:hypothetical protein
MELVHYKLSTSELLPPAFSSRKPLKTGFQMYPIRSLIYTLGTQPLKGTTKH